MRFGRTALRSGLWAAAFALLLQALAPALYAPMSLGATPGFLGDLLVFCEPYRLQPKADHHAHHHPAPATEGDEAPACPVLLGLQAAAHAVPAIPPVVPLPRIVPAPAEVAALEDAASRPRPTPYNPRAPPPSV
jgi:hypothetical protein